MLLVGAILLALFVLPSPWGILAVAVGGTIDVLESVALVRWSRRRRAVAGVEALVGRTAVVVESCRPEGRVRIAGELWNARCAAGADPGDDVRVLGVESLTVLVSPA